MRQATVNEMLGSVPAGMPTSVSFVGNLIQPSIGQKEIAYVQKHPTSAHKVPKEFANQSQFVVKTINR